jgi:hypothetical protein
VTPCAIWPKLRNLKLWVFQIYFLHLLETFPFWKRTFPLTFVTGKCVKCSVHCLLFFLVSLLTNHIRERKRCPGNFLISLFLREFCFKEREVGGILSVHISSYQTSMKIHSMGTWSWRRGQDGRQRATLLKRLAVKPVLEIGQIGTSVNVHCKYRLMICPWDSLVQE